MTRELIEGLTQVLKSGPALQLALVFGSLARGEDRPDSDLDIAILPRDSDLPLSDELALQVALSRVARREVDLVRLDRSTPALRFRVAREGISMLGEPLTLSRFRARAGIEHSELETQRRATEIYLRVLQSRPAAAPGSQ